MEARELQLRIVPLADVLLHEETEPRRVDRLMQRIQEDRMLRNPPVVTEARNAQGQPKYIVLDGASRTSALRALRCRDLLVQIVDYAAPDVRLESWNHLLLDVPPEELRSRIAALPGLALIDMDSISAQDALERRDILGYFLFGDGAVAGLYCPGTPEEQVQALSRVVRTYESIAELYRVASTDLEQLAAEHHRLSAVMVLPHYSPDEIIHLALNGARVPAGITRHIIPGRAMRINLPLEMLERDEPLESKNAWLDTWLKTKIQQRQVRFYQEPVFLFDE